jgi:hypothetical protein
MSQIEPATTHKLGHALRERGGDLLARPKLDRPAERIATGEPQQRPGVSIGHIWRLAHVPPDVRPIYKTTTPNRD